MNIYFLTIFYTVALVTFLYGIKMCGHAYTLKLGSYFAACAFTIGCIGTVLLYRDADGFTILNNLWLLIILALGPVLAFLFSITPKSITLVVLVNLLNTVLGASAIVVTVFHFIHLIQSGVAFPADDSENLPGFVFIFGNFGHKDIFLMAISIVAGTISFTGSVLGILKLYGKIKKVHFKGQKAVNILLVVVLAGYASFFIINTPITTGNFGFALTTTDGTQANAGLYDIHKILFYFLFPLAVFCSTIFTLPFNGFYTTITICIINAVAGLMAFGSGIFTHISLLITAGLLVAVGEICCRFFIIKYYGKNLSDA